MNNTTIDIYYKKKKILALLILALGFLCAHMLYVCKPMFYDEQSPQKMIRTDDSTKKKTLKPWQAIIFTILLTLFAYTLLRKLLRTNPIFSVSPKGIMNNNNNNIIPWSDIAYISSRYGRRRGFWAKPTIHITLLQPDWKRNNILLDPSLMSFKKVSQETLELIDHESFIEFLNKSFKAYR